MNYLFYDIECANTFAGRGKIVSFGYVIVNENFEVFEKREMILNPNADWDRYVKQNITKLWQRNLSNMPKFFQKYDEIKSLLSSHISLGLSVRNDIGFLNAECERYDLPNMEIASSDVQAFYLYCTKGETSSGLSLSKLTAELNIDTQKYTEHISMDDAIMTMLITKALCEKYEISPAEFTLFCKQNQILSKDIILKKLEEKKA